MNSNCDFSTCDFDAFVPAIPSNCHLYYRIEGVVPGGTFSYPCAWIVTADTQKLKIWSCNGYEDIPTPNIRLISAAPDPTIQTQSA